MMMIIASNENVSSVENIYKLKYLPTTAWYRINTFCYLGRTYRAFQWYQMRIVVFNGFLKNWTKFCSGSQEEIFCCRTSESKQGDTFQVFSVCITMVKQHSETFTLFGVEVYSKSQTQPCKLLFCWGNSDVFLSHMLKFFPFVFCSSGMLSVCNYR